MAYKYFDAGPNGEEGKRIDKLCKEKQDNNLRDVFRYPLRIERSDGEEEVEIPSVQFHVMKVDSTKIHTTDDVDRFKRLLSQAPDDLHLILDMEDVSYASIDIQGPLWLLYKAMRAKSRSIFIVNACKAVEEKFKQTRMDRRIPIHSSTREAYEEIQKLAA